MTDIERAAFEEWFEAEIKPKMNGTTTEFMTKEIMFAGYQARASRPVVITDEMVEAGARASWLHHLYPCNDAAWAAFKTEYPDSYAREIGTMRIALSAALNGGT